MSNEKKENPPEPPDEFELQVQGQIAQLKNTYYQISGQQGALFETVVAVLFEKWDKFYKQNKILQAENATLRKQLSLATLEPESEPKSTPESTTKN